MGIAARIWRRRLGIATAVLMIAAGCDGGDKRPNLILISVDTLRPDRLGYAGHTRPTSPTIDKLAAAGVVFTRAASVSGWTLPSMATILTGHYPKDHGATDLHWSLDFKLRTLASVLRQNGYDTHGYVSHVMLTPTYGMGDGFAHYDYTVLNTGHPHDIETSRELTDIAIAGTHRLQEPYFVWVHYFDPHYEYLYHAAFESFGNRTIDRYDGEIAHTDYHIARLLKNVDTDNTIVVFTSDHGEEFGEHGGEYHYTLHGEVIDVPLIIRAPGVPPGRNDSLAEQTDLMPTILSLMDIAPPQDLPGRDLLAGGPDDTPVFIERNRPPPWRQRGVIRGNHKLFIVDLADTTDLPPTSRGTESPVSNIRPGIYMYDIAADPSERTNIYSESNRTALELLALVAGHFRESRAEREAVELDPELIEKLKSLGYIR